MRSGEGAPPTDRAEAEPPDGEDVDELLTELRRLTARNRTAPDRAQERRLLRLRHQAGRQLLSSAGTQRLVEPDLAGLADSVGPPELTPDQLSPGTIRAGILRHGCVLVRGLLDRRDALAVAESIDRSMEARAAIQDGGVGEPGYYEPFEPDPPYQLTAFRPFIERSGLFAVDAPKVFCEVLDLFDRTGVLDLTRRYLGEPPVLSAHKTMLRKITPTPVGGWHQDGSFMHDTHALNLWVSLSRCGDEAPGLDIVPKRIDEIVVLHEDMLKVEVGRRKTEAAAGAAGILRPIFEPGDALFFDEMMLHRTASDPAMPHPRFALETWFFGASSFPSDYAPLAV